MPVYLLHGFRWVRAGFKGIRVYIAVHNLEDAAAEYVQQQTTSRLLFDTLRRTEPVIMARLPELQFIEQYDPEDLYSETAVSQPYAYVADKVITIPGRAGTSNHNMTGGLSVDFEEVVRAHQQGSSATAIMELRDKLAPGEKVGWWIVYNGDPERAYPESEHGEENGHRLTFEVEDEDRDHDGGGHDDEEEMLDSTTTSASPGRSMTGLSGRFPGRITRLFGKRKR